MLEAKLDSYNLALKYFLNCDTPTVELDNGDIDMAVDISPAMISIFV